MPALGAGRLLWLFRLAVFVTGVCPGLIHAATKPDSRGQQAAAGAQAYPEFRLQVRSTQVGEIALAVVNRGVLGSQSSGLRDSCFRSDDPRFIAPSAEFPRGSGDEFLFGGGLWVGGVRGHDTLVAVAQDGWHTGSDFLPQPYPNGDIYETTVRPVLRAPYQSLCPDLVYTDDALSDHDLVLTCTDTIIPPEYSDPGYEPSVPGIELRQSVHSWAKGVASNFNVIHWTISNTGDSTLDQFYLGLFMDFDVYNRLNASSSVFADDVIGSLTSFPSWLDHGFHDSIEVFWAMDADGDPMGIPAQFDHRSARGALGVTVLAPPAGLPLASRNWWVSDSDPVRDWGPARIPTGHAGTPDSERLKYELLANGEFDYDQFEAAVFHPGWGPPSQHAADVANGLDTRGALGFGPYTLPADSSLELWFALVGGRNVHRRADNFAQYWNPASPQAFKDRLDFSDLAKNAVWAQWFFDNPGVDTDGDGHAGAFRFYQGDTIYYSGDGVPDFAGPPAPPTPDITVEAGGGTVVIRWNGRACERTRDRFSLRPDFEGYRVFVSNSGQPYDFAIVSQRDLINFVEMRATLPDLEWRARSAPLSPDSLKSLYDSLSQADYGTPFDQLRFDRPDTSRAFRRVVARASYPGELDTIYSYFAAIDANQAPNDLELAAQDSLGLDVRGAIRRLHPGHSANDSILSSDSVWNWPYYDYEFALGHFNPVMPVYVSVSVFDHGDPELGAEARESPVGENAVRVWPGGLSQLPEEGRAEPGVFPNPYRVSDDYASQGWESSGGEDARRLTFYNLPDTCVLAVWTMDGDLVIKIHHAGAGTTGDASREVWNLVSRHGNALRTGLYIWSVESREGNHAGKLAVLR